MKQKIKIQRYCEKCGKLLAKSEIKRHKTEWAIKPLIPDQINLKEHTIRILGKGGKERITVTSPWLSEKNIKYLPLKIQRRKIQRRITQLSKKVLGRPITFHTLRHGFANYMMNDKGVSPAILQSLLGHSNLSTTSVYTKANPIHAIKSAWESF